jgi:hypothetical protein
MAVPTKQYWCSECRKYEKYGMKLVHLKTAPKDYIKLCSGCLAKHEAAGNIYRGTVDEDIGSVMDDFDKKMGGRW